MSEIKKLSEFSKEEQKALTLFIVQGCLEFRKESGKSLEDIMQEDLFPENASQVFSDMVCYNIKILVDEGILSGDVELVYDELEPGEDASKGISSSFSTFDNISITEKGEAYVKYGDFGVKAVEFKEKAIPFLKNIGNVALEKTVETLVVAFLGALGIPV